MRIYIAFIGLVTACTGSIEVGTGGGDDNPTPPATNVQITVRDGFATEAGVRVLFQNADFTTIAEVPTDAAGLATAEMPNGGNLTVIRTFPVPVVGPVRPAEIYTYVGVKAGDRLVLGHEIDDVGTPSAITVKVPDAVQGTVKIVTSCGTGQGTAPYVAMTVSSCPPNVTFFVADQNQSAFIAQMPYSGSIDLSLQSLSGTLATSLSSTNLATGVTQVDAETRIMDGTFELYSSGSKRVDAQPATINLPNFQNVDELVVATITATNGGEMVATRKAYAITPTVIDASAGLIPYVTAPTYKPTGVSWTEQGIGTADFVIATLDVTPKVGGADAAYRRVIVAPHAGTSLALPTLVGVDSMYNPLTDDQIAGTQGLVQATGGYDAMRAKVFSVANIVQTAPMNGSVTLSYAGNTPPTL